MKATIAQIIPYFGKWPDWIELYLYSCSMNPAIDFIIYTDCDINAVSKYNNIIFKLCTFKDYQQLVSDRLQFDYSIDRPYKLTDLKPFLGAIHQQELTNYKFWSFGDIDLVYGDMSMILNQKNLLKYDIITTHSYHIAGHFTAIKNIPKYNNLCFKIKDWKKKLCNTTQYGLDEGEWSALVFPQLKFVRLIWNKILKKTKLTDFFTYLEMANKLASRKLLFSEYYTSPAPKKDEEWKYSPSIGKVFNPNRKELPYIHFLFFKKTSWFDTENFWPENYYKISSPINQYSEIDIDLNGISGH